MITSDSTFGNPIVWWTFWESDIRKSNFASGTTFGPKMLNLAPCIGQQVLSLRWSAFASSGLRVRCHPTIFLDDDRYKFNRLMINAEKKFLERLYYNFQVRIYRGKGSESKGAAIAPTPFSSSNVDVAVRLRNGFTRSHPGFGKKIVWFKKTVESPSNRPNNCYYYCM